MQKEGAALAINSTTSSIVERVPLAQLEEAYRASRIRLQMCCGSLIYKFNDD